LLQPTWRFRRRSLSLDVTQSLAAFAASAVLKNRPRLFAPIWASVFADDYYKAGDIFRVGGNFNGTDNTPQQIRKEALREAQQAGAIQLRFGSSVNYQIRLFL